MIFISHRGNLTGPEPEKENRIEFIQAAIDAGYDVEIDVRLLAAAFYLGHDGPEYPVELEWLLDKKDHLWIHTKDFNSMDGLISLDLRVFYHQFEKHTVIGNTRNIWSHDIEEASGKSIIPLISMDDIIKNNGIEMKFHGVCSDYIERLKNAAS